MGRNCFRTQVYSHILQLYNYETLNLIVRNVKGKRTRIRDYDLILVVLC